jgi:hypothetical protein
MLTFSKDNNLDGQNGNDNAPFKNCEDSDSNRSKIALADISLSP